MILPTRWRDVPAGARVVDPAGQRWHVLSVLPGIVTVRGRYGETHTMTVAPDGLVSVLHEPEDYAAQALRAGFPSLTYLGER